MFNSGPLLIRFVFFPQNFLISTKNLSGTTIVIFTRCLRSSSLSAFCKIVILRKAHMPESLFNKVVDLLVWNFKDCITDIFENFQWILQKMLRTPFYRTLLDSCFWYLENLTFKHLILNKFVHSINICRQAIFDE